MKWMDDRKIVLNGMEARALEESQHDGTSVYEFRVP